MTMLNRRNFLTILPIGLFTLAAGPALAQQAPRGAPAPRGVTVEDLHRAFQRSDSRIRRDAQMGLKKAGYYRGGIDGAWGPGTANGYASLLQSEQYRRAARDWDGPRERQIEDTLLFLSAKGKR
jgi:hypothetical protein